MNCNVINLVIERDFKVNGLEISKVLSSNFKKYTDCSLILSFKGLFHKE